MEPYRPKLDLHSPGLDEGRLVAQAKSGDRAAFEELVRIHAERLYAVVLRLCAGPHEAEEATQEAFLRAWRAIGRFDGRSQFFTWLYRIGVNEAKRATQRGQRSLHAVSLEESQAEPPDPTEGPTSRVARGEQRATLERAVRALPLEYRAPLILRDVEGLSTSEAAKVLSLSEPAFKSRLHRARLSLRKALEDRLDG